MSFLRGYARRLGVIEYLGLWDASTNTPTLTSSTGQRGGYYIVSTAGSTNLNGITDWDQGDWAIFNGTEWQRVDVADNSRNLAIQETLQFKNLITPPTTFNVSAGTYTITPSSNFTVVAQGTSLTPTTVSFQNATLYSSGSRFHLYNDSNQTLIIRDGANNELFQLYAGGSSLITLVSNATVAGDWVFNLSTSGNFQGAAPVVCSYSGQANVGRYLEFFPANSSDTSPFVIVTDSLLIGLSISSVAAATGTVSLYILPNTTTPIASVSLTGTTTNYVTNLSFSIPAGSQLAAKVTAGSFNKPGIALYLTSV